MCFLNVRFLRRWTSFNLFLPDVDASVSQLSLNGVRFPESAFPDRYDKRSFAKKRDLFLNLETFRMANFSSIFPIKNHSREVRMEA